MNVRRWAPWMLVAVVAVAYPLASLAAGTPAFPSRADCVIPASHDGDIEAVFGYFDSERDGISMRDRALNVGFQGAEIERNACGLVRVVVGGIPTLGVGRDFVDEARAAGFEVTLEQGG